VRPWMPCKVGGATSARCAKGRWRSQAQQEVDDFLLDPCAFHGRQALPDAAAIGSIDQARIANHLNTTVRLAADQTACALFQRNDGLRHLMFHEGVAA